MGLCRRGEFKYEMRLGVRGSALIPFLLSLFLAAILSSARAKSMAIASSEDFKYNVSDLVDSSTASLEGVEHEILVTAETDLESLTPPPPTEHKHPQETSNATAILMGVLFAFTMVVKGIPVVVAYTLRYFSKKAMDVEMSGVPEKSKEIKDPPIPASPVIETLPVPLEMSEEKKREASTEEIDLCDCFICHLDNFA